jgi:hypothetical protein
MMRWLLSWPTFTRGCAVREGELKNERTPARPESTVPAAAPGLPFRIGSERRGDRRGEPKAKMLWVTVGSSAACFNGHLHSLRQTSKPPRLRCRGAEILVSSHLLNCR